MIPIGGNVSAVVQIKDGHVRNEAGERVQKWKTKGTVSGYLDYVSGDVDIPSFLAKMQDTSHIFICDYDVWSAVTQDTARSENCRLIIKNETYNVNLIDNPMQMNQHMEIFLQYVGGGLGG